MNRWKGFGLVEFVCAMTLGVLGLLAQDADVEKLIKELKGEEQAAQCTPEQLQAAYAQALEALLPKMGSRDLNEQKTAQQTFQDICWRAGRPGRSRRTTSPWRSSPTRSSPKPSGSATGSSAPPRALSA